MYASSLSVCSSLSFIGMQRSSDRVLSGKNGWLGSSISFKNSSISGTRFGFGHVLVRASAELRVAKRQSGMWKKKYALGPSGEAKITTNVCPRERLVTTTGNYHLQCPPTLKSKVTGTSALRLKHLSNGSCRPRPSWRFLLPTSTPFPAPFGFYIWAPELATYTTISVRRASTM